MNIGVITSILLYSKRFNSKKQKVKLNIFNLLHNFKLFFQVTVHLLVECVTVYSSLWCCQVFNFANLIQVIVYHCYFNLHFTDY